MFEFCVRKYGKRFQGFPTAGLKPRVTLEKSYLIFYAKNHPKHALFEIILTKGKSKYRLENFFL